MINRKSTYFLLNYYSKFAIMILRKEHTMYEIEFYEDKNGKSEIADYIKELNAKAASSKPSCARQRMRHHP